MLFQSLTGSNREIFGRLLLHSPVGYGSETQRPAFHDRHVELRSVARRMILFVVTEIAGLGKTSVWSSQAVGLDQAKHLPSRDDSLYQTLGANNQEYGQE